MSQQAEFDAIKAAVDARFGASRVLNVKDAAAATTDHIVLFVSRRYTDGRLASGEVTVPGGRAVLRSVCKTPGNVLTFRQRIADALEDKILPGDIGPFTFETQTDVDDDETWFVGSDSFIY